MTKASVLKELIANLKSVNVNNLKCKTVVDCLKELILILDDSAKIDKCFTIVDCLNTIISIKENGNSSILSNTKTECLNQLIKIYDSDYMIDRQKTVAECLTELAKSISQDDSISESAVISEALIKLSNVIINSNVHTHSYVADVSGYLSNGANGHKVTATMTCECGDNYVDVHNEGHNMIDYGDRVGRNQPTKCSHDCGYTSYRTLTPEELTNPNPNHVHYFVQSENIVSYTSKDDTSHNVTVTYQCECGKTYNDTGVEEHDIVDDGDRIGYDQPTKCCNCGFTSKRRLTAEEIKCSIGSTDFDNTQPHGYIDKKIYSSLNETTHEVSYSSHCSNCKKTFAIKETEAHNMIDDHIDVFEGVMITKCEQNCGYTSQRDLTQEEIDEILNPNS